MTRSRLKIRTAATRRSPAPRRVRIIRVLLVEDQAIDAGALKLLLESQADLEVVGSAASLSEGVRKCGRHRPEVLLFDSRMTSAIDRHDLLRLRDVSPDTRVLAMAARGEERCMVLNPPSASGMIAQDARAACVAGNDCLELAVIRGAHGAIRRSATPAELFRAVRSLAAGGTSFDAGTASRLAQRARSTSGPARPTRLSERERMVAERIARGRSNKEIAGDLGIGLPTVKKHVGRILTKLGLDDRLQAGLFLARHPLMLQSGDR